MISPAEQAAVYRTQAQARTKIASKIDKAQSNSTLPLSMSDVEAEEDSNELLLLREDSTHSMGCEIRLKKKCSWAVKPFRYTRTYVHAHLCVF